MTLSALLTVCLTIVSLTSFSQPQGSSSAPKQRWQSLLVSNSLGGVDTLIQGPRREFVLMATYRLITDDNMGNVVRQMSAKNKVIMSLENELSFKNKALIECANSAQERFDEMGRMQSERNEALERSASQKGWATVGRVGTAIVCVGAAALLTVVILDATSR